MKFNSRHALSLIDADNHANEGYLVSASVSFDDLKLDDGECQSILAKSDNGGFALELCNPPGGPQTQLRFGVYVNGKYVYAKYPAAKLNHHDQYFIIAAYDGDGGVRMWINGSDANVNVASTAGGVVTNDSPVVIGGDPQGPNSIRHFFRGTIQQVQLQRWENH